MTIISPPAQDIEINGDICYICPKCYSFLNSHPKSIYCRRCGAPIIWNHEPVTLSKTQMDEFYRKCDDNDNSNSSKTDYEILNEYLGEIVK